MSAAVIPATRIEWLGRQPYLPMYDRMRAFTDSRDADSPDEIWLLEHEPVFTQGMRGKSEHLLQAGDIPVVQSDRGGQITYHGPGQLMVYTLIDLERLGIGIRSLVMSLEQAIVNCLAGYGIAAHARRDAPGVYVGEAKIGSLGLRVRGGCSYHGLALNVAMNLEPFSRINPCGYRGLQMTQVSELGGPASVEEIGRSLLPQLLSELKLDPAG